MPRRRRQRSSLHCRVRQRVVSNADGWPCSKTIPTVLGVHVSCRFDAARAKKPKPVSDESLRFREEDSDGLSVCSSGKQIATPAPHFCFRAKGSELELEAGRWIQKDTKKWERMGERRRDVGDNSEGRGDSCRPECFGGQSSVTRPAYSCVCRKPVSDRQRRLEVQIP